MTPQQTIAHYRITSKLGEGGMGAVYRATDTKLNRDVAIKILPDSFANDPDRLARFTREAQVLASLNHPNIATIYGVEERAIIMELVEGEPLAGPLPVETALQYAGQIAAALEAAHDKGIVHRDLKPANIKITPEGVVKVLDFGLATVAQGAMPSGDPRTSPTLTMAGVIMGTAGYMAPEQARGASVDKRADIWAFGVVLHEMLTGRELFAADTVADSMAAVLTRDPDLTQVPPQVRRLLAQCLQRDPRKRLRDIGDWKLLLDEPAAAPSLPAQRQRLSWLPWSIAVFGVVAAAAVWLLKPAPEQPVLQLDLQPPAGTRFMGSRWYAHAISPDGSRIVFIAVTKEGVRQAWVRVLASGANRVITSSEGAVDAWWSPDSRAIAFSTPTALWSVDVGTGSPRKVCDCRGVHGAWATDGNIYFGGASGLERVASSGGTPEPVFPPGSKDRMIDPVVLPDGKHLIYVGSGSRVGLIFATLDGREHRVLDDRPESPAAFSNGYLFYSKDGQLWARPFDPVRGTFTGSGQPLGGPVEPGPTFSPSPNVLIFRRSAASTRPLRWVDRAGVPMRESLNFDITYSPRISPDDKRIAGVTATGFRNTEIIVYDRERGTSAQLVAGESFGTPVWSSDSRSIAHTQRTSAGTFGIVVRPADGSGSARPVPGVAVRGEFAWSRDGRWFAGRFGPDDGIYFVPAEGGTTIPTGIADGSNPSISPDGRWILYSTSKSGRAEVVAESLPVAVGGSPASRGKVQISNAGGSSAKWRADGKEIFYMSVDRKLMSVSVEPGAGTLRFGVPKPLFQTSVDRTIGVRMYDATNDGKQFISVLVSDDDLNIPITVIHNWKKLVTP